MQDSAPPGGFPNTITYKRNLPKRGPSGAFLIAAAFAVMGYGIVEFSKDNLERRELRREKIWARIHVIPLLQAEMDRDVVRRLDSLAKKEGEIMKNVEGWSPMDLKAPVKGIGKMGVRDEHQAEPVYHTSRYVTPALLFLPKNDESFMPAQWWRGTKIFTKNPAYHEREDFTKEHPIGQ